MKFSLALPAYLNILPLLSQAKSPDQHNSAKDLLDGGLINKDEKLTFQGMSENDKKNRIKSIFKKSDENGDDFLDKTELKKLIVKAGQEFMVRTSKEDFENNDDDEDGFLTWEEFAGFIDNEDLTDDDFKDHINPAMEKQGYKQTKKNLFQAADLDKNEKLNLTEYIMTMHPQEFEIMHKVQ